MNKFVALTIIFLSALTACWSNPPTTLEPVVPVVSNGYTGLKDQTFEFNLSPTANSKKPRPANADKIKTLNASSLRATQARQVLVLGQEAQGDFLDVPVLKARVIAVQKGKVLRPGQVATTTELTAIFDWSSDTPLTGSITLSGYHLPEYAGASVYSSASQTGPITTTKTNQRAPGFTGNAFRYKIPGKFDCVDATWNLASGPFVYRQDQPLRMCKQPVKTDLRVTLTGPRAPKVGFASEYEIKASQLILSAGALNPKLKIFMPDHFSFQRIHWGTISGANPFSVQCDPETPEARVVVCTGSSVVNAIFTLVVRPTNALAETFRVVLSSDTPERNPSDDTASLTVLPVIENTATDLRVTSNTITSSSVFLEDQFEQIVTIKNFGPGVAASARASFSRNGYDHYSILVNLPDASSPLMNCETRVQNLFMECDLPALNVGEEITVRVPWLANRITTNGGDQVDAGVQYAQDTDNTNNFNRTTAHVQVARDPLKEHALEVSMNAPSNVIEGQTHTSSVTVTNHGPNAATSRTLIFTPAFLIPVTAPAGCTKDLESDEILCPLTGMAANTSRTFSFSGTAQYQQYANAEVEVYVTQSGNDLELHPQDQNRYVYVERDPSTLHALEVSMTGLQAEYFVNDAVNLTLSVTNHGPSISPPRALSISKELINLNTPAGCDDQSGDIECEIPSLPVGATWTRAVTGSASTQGTNGYFNANLNWHELDSNNYPSSVYETFAVRGFVGTLSASFTPVPPSSVDISSPQTFTVVITNTGQYTSVDGALNIIIDRPDGTPFGAVTSSIQTACAGPPFPTGNINRFCGFGPIAPGSSYPFSFTVSTSTVGRLRVRASLIGGGNEYTGNIAYHEYVTQNGLPLTLEWSTINPLPSSPPGFAYGSSYPFAVNITNPNTSSKSFSLEVSIPQSGYTFSLGAPSSCSVTTNPVTFDPGDEITRIATCPITLAAGQTSSVFFSANFPACDYNPPQDGANCGSTVRHADVKARVIGATATPLSKRVKVNQ
jgi:hypothetical protein